MVYIPYTIYQSKGTKPAIEFLNGLDTKMRAKVGSDTGESCYLLDQLMGLEHHARITEDAQARILQSDGGPYGPPFFI